MNVQGDLTSNISSKRGGGICFQYKNKVKIITLGVV
jgi:hypothetical protein